MKSQLHRTEATWPQSSELKPWQAPVGKVLQDMNEGTFELASTNQ